jgi:Ribbon-helix-helix protein, copG family
LQDRQTGVTNALVEDTLTVRLDGAVAEELAEEAKRTKRSKGQIVREALTDYLRRSRPNALQAARKYVGCIDGPADLSTNKKHLAGLGQRRK